MIFLIRKQQYIIKFKENYILKVHSVRIDSLKAWYDITNLKFMMIFQVHSYLYLFHGLFSMTTLA